MKKKRNLTKFRLFTQIAVAIHAICPHKTQSEDIHFLLLFISTQWSLFRLTTDMARINTIRCQVTLKRWPLLLINEFNLRRFSNCKRVKEVAVSIWIANKSSKLSSRRRHVQTCWPNSNRFALTNRNVCFAYSWNVTYRDNELSNSSTEPSGLCFLIRFFFLSQFSFLRTVNWMCVRFSSFFFRSCHPCEMNE